MFIRILFKFYLHYGLIPIKFYLRHVLQNVYQRACRLLRARTALHKPPATKRSAHIRTASRAPKRVPTRFLVCFRMCSALRNVYLHACFFFDVLRMCSALHNKIACKNFEHIRNVRDVIPNIYLHDFFVCFERALRSTNRLPEGALIRSGYVICEASARLPASVLNKCWPHWTSPGHKPWCQRSARRS